MCDDCRRKMAVILASVLATGTLAFADDDRDPEENEHDRLVMQDVSRLLSYAATFREQGPSKVEEQEAAMTAFYNEIGGQRFAYAVTSMLFLERAIEDARELGGLLIRVLAETTDMPGPKKWMAKNGAAHGLTTPASDAGLPPEVRKMAAMLRRQGLEVDIEQVEVAGLGSTMRRDKPVGTGPNGEPH